MKRVFICALIGLGALTGGSAARAANVSPSATVENTAVVSSATSVVFEFDLYDCPAGSDIAVVDWTANEPSRPDSGAAGGLQPYGLSNGTQVQHLVLEVGSAGFLAGERWVGSGTIACGAVLIPVSGSGQAKSLTGV